MLKYSLLFVLLFIPGCLESPEVELSNLPGGHSAGAIVTLDTELAGKGEIERLARTLRENGVNATFFVVAGYYRDNPRALEPLEGFEVGSKAWDAGAWKEDFSPGGQAEQMLRAERWLESQGFEVEGFRAPYLSHGGYSLKAARALNYTYDSSLYYGFLPYRVGDIMEIPLSINFDPFWDQEKEKSTRLPTYLMLQKAIHSNGYFTMLTHVSRVSNNIESFTGLLNYSRERGVWFCSAGQAARWWEKREGLEMEVGEKKVKVHNRGRERVRGATVIFRGFEGEVERGIAQYRRGEDLYVVLPPLPPKGSTELIFSQ